MRLFARCYAPFRPSCIPRATVSGNDASRSPEDDKTAGCSLISSTDPAVKAPALRLVDDHEVPAGTMAQWIDLNISGECLSVKRSTLCAVKGSVMATLFSGQVDDEFVRDAHGRWFLPVYAPAFNWMVEKLTRYEQGAISVDDMGLSDAQKRDLPFSYWVNMLLRVPTDQQRDRSTDSTEADMGRLRAIKPLLRSPSKDDNELVTLDVIAWKVTVTVGASRALGETSNFFRRFNTYDRSSVCPLDCVRRVVDLAVRASIQSRPPSIEDVRQSMGASDLSEYRETLDLFGIDSSVYLSPGEGDWLLTQEHIDFIRNSEWDTVKATDDLDPHVAHLRAIPARLGEPIKRLYRASVDGWRWAQFLDAVKGHSPLLLMGRVEGTGELFAVAIAGQIDVTADNGSEVEAKTALFKLKRPAGYRQEEGLLGGSKLHLAGLRQLRVEDDITAKGTTVRALLVVSGFDMGILPSSAGQRPPSVNVAMLHSLKRCHAFAPSSFWPTWERAKVHVPGWETISQAGFSPASVRGWYFDLDELEAYALA
ncbi:unnamed protein product [Vitrella brassicaformis CCMP3155]|uniref:BTB domain-containing protein n=1 Tax=Vitrella brassicaformis (strain CCMP3155) TaxID=1169540 RepID=A0A0G4GF15_VITBC|nr:unnamed protein product [Vitrella brassicaformis CCMP3155]|eukprot:CEM28099.1 unnamed protein product [Vitrella brassicaformis CCMP3155]